MEKVKGYLKSGLKYIFIIFIILNLLIVFGLYQKYFDHEQPYKEAKYFRIPADILNIYAKYLVYLPRIDENSIIVQPLFELRNWFIEKSYSYIPDDDIEKHLEFFMKYNIFLRPNVAPGNILYDKEVYSYKEVREFMDEMWKIIEVTIKYNAKDPLFQKIRYQAFTYLSAIYISNRHVYWLYDNRQFNDKLFKKDIRQYKRFKRLDEYIKQMDLYHKKNHRDWYDLFLRDYVVVDIRAQKLQSILLRYQLDNNYPGMLYYCNLKKNKLVNEYLIVRDNLLKAKSKTTNEEDIAVINQSLSKYVDYYLNQYCQLNIKEGELYYD